MPSGRPRSLPTWSLVALSLVLPPILGACGEGPVADRAQPSGASEAAAERARLLYRAPGEEPSGGVRASMERQDPTRDGWETERLHDLASLGLKDLLAWIGAGSEGRGFDQFLTPDFEGSTALVPEELEILLEDDAVRLSRAVRLPEELHPQEELPRLVEALLLGFDTGPDAPPLDTKARLYTSELDPRSPRHFTTRAVVTLGGPAPDGVRQVRAHWSVRWREIEGVHGPIARVHSIRLESYEESLASAPLFADVSATVLGDVPQHADELLRGTAEYEARSDTLNGSAFAGTHGVAVADVDGDGLDDLFLPQQGGLPNRLLLHRPDGTVRDASEGSGLDLLDDTQSALFCDLDDDGDQDAVLAVGKRLVLRTNDGSGHFGGETVFPADGQLSSLTAVDWDADGDLDLYACNYGDGGPLEAVPEPYYDAHNGGRNLALRNDGDGAWTEVTAEVGLDEDNDRFSYAAVWEDFDEDGDPDLYVVNDYGRNDLYLNEGGRFREAAVEAGADDLAAGMGVTAADLDSDGDVDLFVTDMWSPAGRRIVAQEELFRAGAGGLHESYMRHARGNAVLLNRGDGTFEDASEASGARNAGWAFGAIAADLNNDTHVDLYAPNGFLSGPKVDDL